MNLKANITLETPKEFEIFGRMCQEMATNGDVILEQFRRQAEIRRDLYGSTVLGGNTLGAPVPTPTFAVIQPTAEERAELAEAVTEQGVQLAARAAVRERGKPSAGRARRTKEEIAEDEAADRIDAERQQAATDAGLQVTNVSDVAQISSGEERVGPEDTPEVQEQDRADEQAESAAAAPAGKKLSHDDVRKALGAYVTKFGMAAAQEDGPKVIAMICGAGKVKISDIPDDQTLLGRVVAGIEEMLEKNPFDRAGVA